MGSKGSKSESDSDEVEVGSAADETWFLAAEVKEHGDKNHLYAAKEAFGDTTLFINGPEFDETEIEDPPEKFGSFQPLCTSSEQHLNLLELNNSYDRVPKPSISDEAGPVRGRARKELPGWDCTQCIGFWKAIADDSQEFESMLNKCSRHRSMHKRKKSPKGFWNPGWNSSTSE